MEGPVQLDLPISGYTLLSIIFQSSVLQTFFPPRRIPFATGCPINLVLHQRRLHKGLGFPILGTPAI